MSISERLKCCAEVLAILDERRRQTGDTNLGSGLERFIVWRELCELEEEIAVVPGELARWVAQR